MTTDLTTTQADETPEAPVTATLKILKGCFLEVGFELNGFIYDDSRGIYKNGHSVITSPIKEVTLDDNNHPVKLLTESGTIYNVIVISDRDEWVALVAASAGQ